MITRIEIDGFKSFVDFSLDVPPFLALVGPNAGGKSNLFDALEYLKGDHLDSEPALLTARRGRPHELFHWDDNRTSVGSFRISVDAIVTTSAGAFPVRYQAGAEYDDRLPDAGPMPVANGLFAPYPAAASALPASVRDGLLASIDERDQALEFDDVGQGWRHLQGELRTWHPHVCDPVLMRRGASAADKRPLTADGSNLAAVLGRMRGSAQFDDLLVDLAGLLPGVSGVEPVLNERQQEWEFEVRFTGQGTVPASVASDGTLRVLALLAALYDPDHPGVLLIEEIENGLHPSRLTELLRRIDRIVGSPNDLADLDKGIQQVIVTSHSPVVVSALARMRPEAVMFVDTAIKVSPGQSTSRVSRVRPIRDAGEPGTYVSRREVRRYLNTVQRDVV